jgi:hypothetical protein
MWFTNGAFHGVAPSVGLSTINCWVIPASLNASSCAFFFRSREIKSCLQVHPQSRRRTERLGQIECRFRGNATLPLDQLIEPRARPSEALRKLRLSCVSGQQKFFEQFLAWMKRFRRLLGHFLSHVSS